MGWRLPATGLRLLSAFALVVGIWWLVVWLTNPPSFVLPSPEQVLFAFQERPGFFLSALGSTALGLVAGLATGLVAGFISASVMVLWQPAARFLLPILVVTQALPVFAIAPLLVVWLGFGMASKAVMAGLIIFFPLASSLADGLARTPSGLLDLARLAGAGRFRTFLVLRLPASGPSLATGLRIALSVAPIGAVVGEWVGASSGLGALMIHANARMKTADVFVALFLLAALVLALRFLFDLLVDLVPVLRGGAGRQAYGDA